MSDKKSLGICLGASTVSIVLLKEQDGKPVIESVVSHNHEGDPMKFLKENIAKYEGIPSAVTGRKFRNLINLPQITEAEAIEEGLSVSVSSDILIPAVVSAGSETFIIYTLDSKRHIKGILTGSKCASGTGEFFLQQLRRMNVTLDEAIEKALESNPYKISGRCSVFCKSDCTHALNKGEPIGSITAGLCDMMAQKILELMPRIPKQNIAVVGGVTKNKAVTDILSKDIDNLIVPKESSYFEAFGTALWAMKNSRVDLSGDIFKPAKYSFTFLPPISDYENSVTFKERNSSIPQDDDICIIGLDVGSTTTKAVLMRVSDDACLASCYLRTNGDPVGASRNCFKEIQKQIKASIKIKGLGVTGSGRYISSLYVGTDAVINEIIAHAEAALYFDKDVDTIFEIGGQDAKYTFLVNGVPCDYAMNEACSAGTGSFLEESAKESLGINTTEIGDIALTSKQPPNFNDQCSAFISSDIKNAIQEGISVNDITAGLVYSICLNYNNKVRGPRTAGKKVFMQGGVCYNKAIPMAMAGLTGCHIIVPPEPGLMGAFGVALEVKRRQKIGLLLEHNFDLIELIERHVEYGKTFECAGGKEKCDRKCQIQMVIVNGEKIPFGGACNKYYNVKADKEESSVNLVKIRQELLFNDFYVKTNDENAQSIGINRSFLTHLLYPLYYNFFTMLGFKVVLPDKVMPEGINRKGASFCHPYETAHGYYLDLLNKNTDYVILPHIRELFVPKALSRRHDMQATCQLVQSETYCFKEAFADLEKNRKVLRPIFDFSKGYKADEKAFRNLACSMGKKGKIISEAFDYAVEQQESFNNTLKKFGKFFLEELEKNPEKTAIVVFGRPYNAMSNDINMGIPEKFSSRGIPVIPYDMLPYDDEPVSGQMHWATGQMLLKAASFVEKHPQLYGVWITNFSCGPDSFLQRFFRDIMGRKPSLTLELDSHTADAGITTRVEAFLDIVDRYRIMKIKQLNKKNTSQRAEIIMQKKVMKIKTPDGKLLDLNDKNVRLVLPSMGWFTVQAGEAVFKKHGFNVLALDEPDSEALKLGRANTSCKECLPLILIAGMLEKFLKEHKISDDEIVLFFVPKSEGGCRLGQYTVFLENHLINKNINNVILLSLDGENNYAGLETDTLKDIVTAMTVADMMDDIYNTIFALAENREESLAIFMEEWKRILDVIKTGGNFEKELKFTANKFRNIKLKIAYEKACKVLLCGEIYVRKERFTSNPIIKSLGERGIVVKTATFNEWLFYLDYMVSKGVLEANYSIPEMISHNIQHLFRKYIDDKYRKIMASSGLIDKEGIDIKSVMDYGKKFMSYYFGGDPILSCGSAMKEIFHAVSGIVVIGPFACMQSRVTEAILRDALTPERKKEIEGGNFKIPESVGGVPFLAIETDGNALPQILEAKIETFAVQSLRVNEAMLECVHR